MKIRVTPENKLEIEAALKSANGKAANFVFSTFDEIQSLAEDAEITLDNICLPLAARIGAMIHARSGEQVAYSYTYSRNVTSVALLRGSKDWFLVYVEREKAGPHAKRPDIFLTKEQDLIAVKKLRSQYSVFSDSVVSQNRPDTEAGRLPGDYQVGGTA